MFSLKTLSLATAGALWIAFGVGTAQAATFKIFNTGVANDGSALPDNSIDPHYTIPVSVNGPSNAFAVAANPLYVSNSSTFQWIGPIPNAGNINVSPGLFTYRTTFDLTGLNPNTAVLQGNFSSDNNTVNVLINGASTGITSSSAGYTSLTPFSINSGFVNGINTLDFIVNNEDSPSGLLTEFTQATANAQATTVSVPEPSSALGTLAFGILGAGYVLRCKVKKQMSTSIDTNVA